MRVKFLFFFILLSTSLYSQTWQVASDIDVIYEYTVITKQQFDRLLRQYEAQYAYVLLNYFDVLEMGEAEVISGQIPALNGYYYMLGKIIPQTQEQSNALSLSGAGSFLVYGNTETGEMIINFLNELGGVILFSQGAVKIKSNDYIKRFNQFNDFVNGVY